MNLYLAEMKYSAFYYIDMKSFDSLGFFRVRPPFLANLFDCRLLYCVVCNCNAASHDNDTCCLCDSDVTATAAAADGDCTYCASIHVQFISDSAAEILAAPRKTRSTMQSQQCAVNWPPTSDKCRHFLYICWW